MTALVIRADAAHLPLPDASVDLAQSSVRVESCAQGFPLGTLGIRPEHSEPAVVVLFPKESHGSVILRYLSDEQRANEPMEHQGIGAADGHIHSAAPVAQLGPFEIRYAEDTPDLVQDGRASVCDLHAEVRCAAPPVAECDGPLAINDSCKPPQVGRVNDRKWSRLGDAALPDPALFPAAIRPIATSGRAVAAIAMRSDDRGVA